MSSHYVIGLINRNFSLNLNWLEKILHKLAKKKKIQKKVIYVCKILNISQTLFKGSFCDFSLILILTT